MLYRVFSRTWWQENPSYPNGLEPSPGRKYTLSVEDSETLAREACRAYNETHKPGRLSRKAEFEAIPPKRSRRGR